MMWLSLVAWAAADQPITASVDLYTSFPTDIGLRGGLELPGRLRSSTSIGLLPDSYLASIHDIAAAQGWYDERTATLITAALQHALVFRQHVGWRPLPNWGFQTELGYSWMGLGGGLTASDIIFAETGYDFSAYLGDAFDFDAQAALHRLELSLGYEWVIRRHLLVRFDLGGSYTFAANATIERQFDVPFFLDGTMDKLEDDTEVKLEEVLEKYVHTPILALGVGWRF